MIDNNIVFSAEKITRTYEFKKEQIESMLTEHLGLNNAEFNYVIFCDYNGENARLDSVSITETIKNRKSS